MIERAHDHMIEKTWIIFLQWESLSDFKRSDDNYGDKNNTAPKLLTFQGRPMDLSPKVAFKYDILGHPLIFDRHDWNIETPKEL